MMKPKYTKNNWLLAFIVSLFVGGVLSLFASSSPDGLEKVAEQQGFLEMSRTMFAAPLSDYVVSGIPGEMLGASLAGFLGTAVVFILLFFFGRKLFSVPLQKE